MLLIVHTIHYQRSLVALCNTPSAKLDIEVVYFEVLGYQDLCCDKELQHKCIKCKRVVFYEAKWFTCNNCKAWFKSREVLHPRPGCETAESDSE